MPELKDVTGYLCPKALFTPFLNPVPNSLEAQLEDVVQTPPVEEELLNLLTNRNFSERGPLTEGIYVSPETTRPITPLEDFIEAAEQHSKDMAQAQIEAQLKLAREENSENMAPDSQKHVYTHPELYKFPPNQQEILDLTQVGS